MNRYQRGIRVLIVKQCVIGIWQRSSWRTWYRMDFYVHSGKENVSSTVCHAIRGITVSGFQMNNKICLRDTVCQSHATNTVHTNQSTPNTKDKDKKVPSKSAICLFLLLFSIFRRSILRAYFLFDWLHHARIQQFQVVLLKTKQTQPISKLVTVTSPLEPAPHFPYRTTYTCT